jgi:hypothetical protein
MEATYTWRRVGGWAALAMVVLWLLAFVTAVVLGTQVFPGYADRFIPAKIQAHLIAATLDGTAQLLMGTALVALAFGLSFYLATPLTPLMQIALLAGIVGGVFMIAAGAGLQENVFTAIFSSAEQNAQLAAAMGVPDVTLINATNAVVAGGMRSTAAYGTGWAMVLWGIVALRTKRLPTMLNWIGIVTGVLFALTVWIGPFTGPIAFLGMLIWHGWLGVRLLRGTAARVMPANEPTRV